MAIVLDGATKTITLSSATTYTDKSIYDACVNWSVLYNSMQYLLPMDFVSPNFRLLNGWKLTASGYASGTLITVTGSIIAVSGDRVVGGVDVEWDIGTANNTIIVAGALSAQEHSLLELIPTIQAVNDSV